jgi:type II secretory pathway pseudopilin PulG
MTLVELLVVVVILLLLAVTTIPRLMPTDVQRGRDAALSVTAMASRVLRRAEQNYLASNGARSAGLWLQPLDPVDVDQPNDLLKGTGRSKGVADLFVCEPQDPYRGDEPESAKVHVHHAVGMGPTQAVLLFSTLTSPNVREFCRSSSRISFEDDVRQYFLRILTATEQTQWVSNNPTKLPAPYRPSGVGSPNVGYYRTKLFLTDALQYKPFDPPSTVTLAKGDGLLAFVEAIPPHAAPPAQPPISFNPGAPPDSSPYDFPGADVGWKYTIQRPVTRSAAAPISLPDGFGIDLAWSSFGDRLLAQPGALVDASGTPLAGVGTMIGVDGLLSHHPVMVMLSDKGGVQSLYFHRRQVIGGFASIVEDRIDDPVDVYLLVGRLDRAGRLYTPFPSEQNPGANWQYPDSRWIRISRVNGEFLISDPLPGAADVRSSQQYSRLGISTTRN